MQDKNSEGYQYALKLIAECKTKQTTNLDLGYCGLTELPQELFELTHLEELYLSNNYWDYKNKEWINSKNTFGLNNLSKLDVSFSKLKHLRVLVAAGGYGNNKVPIKWQIRDISVIRKLKQLSSLNLNDNYISDISAIKELKQLSSLDLSSNNIRNILSLQKLKQLNSLDLSYNSIRDISVIKELKQLSSLDLSSTNISDISILRGLKQLSSLDLSDCKQIKTFSTIRELRQLLSLDISDNKQVRDFSCVKNLKNLTSLDLSHNNIGDISGIEELTRLSSLNLNHNNISDISKIKQLKSLTSLDISHNNISDISDLKLLSSLNLSSNKQIKDFYIIREFKQLRSLDLSDNKQIKNFSILKKLKQLSSLRINNNKISDINFLKELKQLRSLELNNNNISDISVIETLKNLTSIDLSNNNINEIKPLLHILRKGIPLKLDNASQCIIIGENPLQNPPIEIAKEGNEAVLNYFAEKEKHGTTALYEAKMLIIGEGGAGKTSLARRLISGEEAILPAEKETTKGIDILEYKFKTKEGKDFKLNLWDFGGQEIYHATHQFFLTKRSLYVLVDNTRKDDKSSKNASFNYWLEVVELLSENSPLLIVQNEVDDRSKDLAMKEISERCENIKERYKTNLLTSRGVNEVKNGIEYFVQKMPHIGQELPTAWVTIREELQVLSKTEKNENGLDYIDLERYLAICTKHNIDEEKRALFLSEYLHDLGAFLHFQDDRLLRNIFILNNEWATDAVYKVLDNEDIKGKNGRFNHSDLDIIWSDKKYRRKHSQLLKLMEKFELAYKISDSQVETWLAPRLLAVEPDDYAWEDRGNLQLKYSYGFLPKGTVSRLMVRLHRLITDNSTSWLSGFFLQDEAGNKALIKEDYQGSEISIRVSGNSRRDLMAIITEAFETLHKTYGSKLRVEKQVPCNCNDCKDSPKPHFYEYSDLNRRREKGQPTVECKESFENIEVAGLLSDVFSSRMLGEFRATRDLRAHGIEKAFREQEAPIPQTIINIEKGNVVTGGTVQNMEAIEPQTPIVKEEKSTKLFENWQFISFLIGIVSFALAWWIGGDPKIGAVVGLIAAIFMIIRNPKKWLKNLTWISVMSFIGLLTFNINLAFNHTGENGDKFSLEMSDPNVYLCFGLLVFAVICIYFQVKSEDKE